MVAFANSVAYDPVVNSDAYPYGKSGRLTLNWSGDEIAVLRLRRNQTWQPLPALAVFVVFWYAALLTAIDFSQAVSPWQALWQTLKGEPFLILFFLLPLFPMFMIIRDTFMNNRMVFDKRKQEIRKGRKRLMGFRDVDSLNVRVRQEKKSMRSTAELSLQAKSGRSVFLTRCGSYEACAALAQEIAIVVNAQIKNA
ncbi:MAG TPA: hypothetical protein ENN40_02280 [Candidatus Aminicenantes bacterium]|nr:hypothetical protein [Candidatus Aminicenantes bacterium]